MLEHGRELLVNEGFSVVEATCVSQALSRLEQLRIDAVVSDVNMPCGMEGVELARAAKARQPSTPVILYTERGHHEEEALAFRHGADDYVILQSYESPHCLTLVNAIKVATGSLFDGLWPSSGTTGSLRRTPIVMVSPPMKAIARRICRLGASAPTVLLIGDTGTGKEVIARMLHVTSRRAKGPFQAVNCGSIPAGLAEATFFGHARGAFTSAHEDKPGLVEAAHGGTLFLDEVGELPEPLQPLLLRFLDTGEFRRVGETRTRYTDVRIIAATNRRLDQEVANSRFRHDLFWRLAREVCFIPALRERPEDVAAIIDEWCNRDPDAPFVITSRARARLVAHPWPGNFRELTAVLERATRGTLNRCLDERDIESALTGYAFTRRTSLTAAVCPGGGVPSRALFKDVVAPRPYRDEDEERTQIELALVANKHRIGRTAAALGISRSTLYRRLRHYKLLDET